MRAGQFNQRGRLSFAVVALCAACQAKPPVQAPAALPRVAAAEAKPKLTVSSPAAGQQLVRNVVDGRAWAAKVLFAVEPADVSRVQFLDDAEPLGEAQSAPWQLEAYLHRDGPHTLKAIGYDAEGRELVRTQLSVVVLPPVEDTCTAQLTSLQLKWRKGRPERGIADPVVLEPVVEGVLFRPKKHPQGVPMLMDCNMAIRMRELALLLKEHRVDEVITLGIYNYRTMRNDKCMKAGNCKLSQHAFATALDILAFGVGGKQLTVLDDWIVDKSARVCPGKPKHERDALLHAIACGMHDRRVFSVILTPNYNSRHRDHFHVDLTESWQGIRAENLGIDPEIEGIDPETEGLGD